MFLSLLILPQNFRENKLYKSKIHGIPLFTKKSRIFGRLVAINPLSAKFVQIRNKL